MKVIMQNSVIFLTSKVNYMGKEFLKWTLLIEIIIVIINCITESSAEVVARVRRITKNFMLLVLIATSINAMEPNDAIYDFWVVIICTGFIVYDYWIRCRKGSVSLWDITIKALKVIKTKFVNSYVRYTYENKYMALMLCLSICGCVMLKVVCSYFKKIILAISKILIDNMIWIIIIVLTIIILNYIDVNFWPRLLKDFILIAISSIQSIIHIDIDWKIGCMLVPLITGEVLIIDTLIKRLIFKILKDHKNKKERQEEKQKILLIRELMSTVVIPGLVDISSGSMNSVLFFTIWSGCTIAFTYWYEL